MVRTRQDTSNSNEQRQPTLDLKPSASNSEQNEKESNDNFLPPLQPEKVKLPKPFIPVPKLGKVNSSIDGKLLE